MRRLTLLAALLLTTLAAAQPSFIGQAFPLTNTRYGQTGSTATLASDGRDFYAFWWSDSNIRMTRVTPGERRAGRPVVSDAYELSDVLWTGTHFLIVVHQNGRVAGQFVSPEGERLGGPFPIATGAYMVRVATNRSRIVALYEKGETRDAVWSATLTTRGALVETRQLLPATTDEYVHSRYAIASNGDGFAAVVLRRDKDRLLTFDGTGEVRSIETFGAGGTAATMASDGTGYLVAATTAGTNTITRVGADGTMHDTVTLEESGTVTSLVHTADGWLASLVADGRVQVVHLDPSGLSVAAAEPVVVEAAASATPQLATAGQRVMLTWRTPREGLHVAELPLDPRGGSPLLFGATSQNLLATAAGPHSTLFVWAELAGNGATLYAGTLTSDGTWTEEILKPWGRDYNFAHAVADSDGFVVIYPIPGPPFSFVRHRVSAEGRSLGPPVTIKPPIIYSIIWDGDRHVFTSVDTTYSGAYASDYITVNVLNANGVQTRAAQIFPASGGGSIEEARIAFNGRNYLVVAAIRDARAYVIEAVMLDANLRPSGNPMVITKHASGPADVVWDGTDFAVVYPEDVIHIAHVAPTGYLHRFGYIRGSGHSVRAAAVAGGVVVMWSRSGNHYVAAVQPGIRNEARVHTVIEAYGDTWGTVQALGGSRAVLVAAAPVEAAPHHGARRLMAAVLDIAPLRPITTAPRVTVTAQSNNRLQIDWTALDQPVTGYRVEYRVGDGNWNEIERFPDPAVRTATFTATRPGTTYSFRVRAMNEAGMGPYSEPAQVRPAVVRRRAVR